MRTAAVIFAGRFTNPRLVTWLSERCSSVLIERPKMIGEHLTMWRNRVIASFVAGTLAPDATHILLADDDMIPDHRTESLLAYNGNAASALCVLSFAPRSLCHPGHFSAAFCRLSREACAKAAPLFDWEFTPDGTQKICCECAHAHRRLEAAGYRPAKIGAVGHLCECWPTQQEIGAFAGG